MPFEEEGDDLEAEASERDHLYADFRAALEGLAEVQQKQERLKEEQKHTRDSLDTSFIELNNRRDLHVGACRGLEDVGKKTIEMKRKAAESVTTGMNAGRKQRNMCRPRTERRDVRPIHRLGGSHAPSCGVPDPESNEARYLQAEIDMVEEFQ